jgi:Sporulation delaying protein SdpA
MLVALTVVFAVTWVLQVVASGSASVWWARQAKTASLVWHQEWRVFTRAPVGPDTVAYDARDLTLITMYATSPGNRWGLSRIAYTQWMETVALEHVVPADRWHTCTVDVIEQCRPVLASIPAFPVANPTRDATLCGQIVFSRETPIPWPDAEPATGRTRRISAVSRLDVTCGR